MVFQFELTVPNAITSSDALDQLNNRTKIDRWTDDGTGQWVRTNLWPSSPQSFHPPATSPTDPTFASLTLIAATVPMGFDVKFSTVTWETDGPWTRNTSFQEWGP